MRAKIPVFCVGNAVAGGAGKTPAVLALAELLRAHGHKPFALSRGYGGRQKGPLRVSPSEHTAHDVGDEALLLASAMPTVVSRDRPAGAAAAAREGAELVLMDDGFQNPSLHKDFSLLVIDGAYGFGNGRLLPAGPLRESAARALARADAVLIIGDARIASTLDHSYVFQASALHSCRETLAGRSVVGFAGIGRPEKFERTLKDMGAVVKAFIPYPDHHPYKESELDALAAKAEAEQALLVTTAKDAMRLSPQWRQRVTVVDITLHIANAARLLSLMEEKLKQ